MKKQLIVILFLSFLSVNNACNSKSGNRKYKNNSDYYKVTKIVDGDTFWAAKGDKPATKIRLIGVDTPESRNSFKKKVGYYGKEAKEYLRQMLSRKCVKIVCDVDSLDQFKRTLAYVYLEDGTFVNAELVKNGFAMVMTVSTKC